MTRGIKHDTDRLINDLQAQYFDYTHKEKGKMLVQMAVRPINLYELVFPKEHLGVVMQTLWRDSEDPLPKHATFLQKMRLEVMRKALMAKKCPDKEFWKDSMFRPLYKSNVQCYPIGIKEDDEASWGEFL